MELDPPLSQEDHWASHVVRAVSLHMGGMWTVSLFSPSHRDLPVQEAFECQPVPECRGWTCNHWAQVSARFPDQYGLPHCQS